MAYSGVGRNRYTVNRHSKQQAGRRHPQPGQAVEPRHPLRSEAWDWEPTLDACKGSRAKLAPVVRPCSGLG